MKRDAAVLFAVGAIAAIAGASLWIPPIVSAIHW